MSLQLSVRNIATLPQIRSVMDVRSGRAHNDDSDTLERIGTRMVLRRHQPLFQEGDQSDAVYRVVSGAVRTSRVMPDGRRYVADFLFPGDFIGLNDQHVRTVTAEALCDVILIRYSRGQFNSSVETDRGLGRMILSILSGGLTNAQERLLLLGRKTATERVASFLLMMAEREGAERIELPMSRSDIADYLGLTIETISRTITLLKAKGMIRMPSATTVIIQDHNSLEDLAESA